jgi:hypothetical protein
MGATASPTGSSSSSQAIPLATHTSSSWLEWAPACGPRWKHPQLLSSQQ